jgi:hypothetical protein
VDKPTSTEGNMLGRLKPSFPYREMIEIKRFSYLMWENILDGNL